MLSRSQSMHRPRKRSAGLGFTLIEVMVAIMVFASLSIAAYQVVNQVQRSNQQSAEKTSRLQEIQRAMIIMDSDFRQMASRTFKGRANANGTRLLYVDEYLLDSQSQGILFTRLGWQNPQQAFPRGEIVKVGYRITDNQLERVWWRYPDNSEGQEPLHKTLLSKVDELSFRFYDGASQQWKEAWEMADQLPAAIEVSLQLQDYQQVRRVYLTPQGQSTTASDTDDEVTQ